MPRSCAMDNFAVSHPGTDGCQRRTRRDLLRTPLPHLQNHSLSHTLNELVLFCSLKLLGSEPPYLAQHSVRTPNRCPPVPQLCLWTWRGVDQRHCAVVTCLADIVHKDGGSSLHRTHRFWPHGCHPFSRSAWGVVFDLHGPHTTLTQPP